VVLAIAVHCPPARAQSAAPGTLGQRAEAARDAGETGAAINLYREALDAAPDWAAGWWQLGTLLYERDDYAGAAAAFGRATSLNPSAGTAWVMLGLCEFNLRRFDAALEHIRKGRELGTSDDPQFRQVMLFHEAELLLEKGEFERGQEMLDALAAEGVEDAAVVVRLGLAVLRIRPSELPQMDAAAIRMVQHAGRAEHLAARRQIDDARLEYERLGRDFPSTRNVHYAAGRFFMTARQPEEAVAAFLREIETSPDHVPARLGIAAIKAVTEPAVALEHAEAAVRLNPGIPLGHYLLGKLLVDTPQIDRAIAELETAERAVQGDPGIYYALARAYTRAGRTADAERARAMLTRLTREHP
jgi:tetratricopeptide (TPR) repeat protein